MVLSLPSLTPTDYRFPEGTIAAPRILACTKRVISDAAYNPYRRIMGLISRDYEPLASDEQASSQKQTRTY